MQKQIRVTGKGNVAFAPDTTVIKLENSNVVLSYEGALSQSAKDVTVIKDCLEAIGFQRSDLKTSSFEIDRKYQSYRDRNNEWKEKFVGYRYEQRLKLSFPTDNQTLGKVLYALAHCGIDAEIRIEYTVSDQEAAKEKLLESAVADSRKKAQILARSAGVTLGEIVDIDYSWSSIELFSRPFRDDVGSAEETVCYNSRSYDIDVEPEDIHATDTVTIIWAIT